MKKYLKTFAVVLLMTIFAECFSFGTAVFAEDDNNLVQNGGFENGVIGWNTKTLDETAEYGAEYAYSGNGGLKLVSGLEEQYISQRFNIDRSKCYELSAWIKCDGFTEPAAFYMSLIALRGKNDPIGFVLNGDGLQADVRKLYETGGTHGWKKFSYLVDGSRFDVEATMAELYCYVDGGTSGTVYVDDIQFREAEFAVVGDFERFGNVLLQSEEIGVNLKTYNNSSVARKLNVEYTITNDFKSPILSGSDSYEINANTTESHFLKIPLEKCGSYYYYIRIMSEDGSVDQSLTDSFCIIMQDNSDNTLDDYGVCGHMNTRRRNEATVQQIVEASDIMGSGIRRDEFRWENAEKVKGTYQMTDKVYNCYFQTKQAGNVAMVLLGFGNVLYDMESIAIVPHTEAQMEGWRNYCAYVVKAMKELGYADDEVIFEVWNEYTGGSGNKTAEPASHYVNILKIAYEEVKKVMPNAMVITEGMQNMTDGAGIDRFTVYCETGVPDYCDAINVHPYTRPEQPDDRDIYENAIADFRGLLKKFGYEDKPFIISELGWNVHIGDTYGEWSAREQAIGVIRHYLVHKKTQAKYNQQDIIVWYKAWEEWYTKDTQSYGLINAPWNVGDSGARVGYASFNALATLMNRAKYIEANDRGNVKIHKLKTENGEDMLVMWTADAPEEINVACGGTPEFHDMTGARINVPVKDGKFEMTLTREPVFVVGKLPETAYESGAITLKTKTSTSYKGDSFKVTIQGNEKYAGARMEVEAELPDKWEWVNKDIEMTGDGSYDLEIYAPEDNFGNSMNHLWFTVSIDGKPVTRLDYQQETVVPVSSEARHIYMEYDGKMQDVIKISVSNNSSNSDISGYVSVKAPAGLMNGNEKLGFNIGSGGEEYFYIPVTDYPELGYYTFEYDVYQTGVNTPYSYTKVINYMNVGYAEKPPTLDGVISSGEWNEARAVNITDPRYMNTAVQEQDPVPPDTTGKLYSSWDNENLYAAAVINDDVHYNTNAVGRLWDGDSIQIALDAYFGDPTVQNWVEYCIAITEEGVLKEQDKRLPHQKDNLAMNIKAAAKRNEALKQTVYEIAIPWSEAVYEGMEFDPENEVGISFVANDHDGIIRKGFAHYMLGIADGKYKERFGSMYFADDPGAIKEITLAVDNPKAMTDENIKYIDSENTRVKPVVLNGRTLVPARFISENFGAKVEWDDVAAQATITKGNTKLKFGIGSDVYYKNGVAAQMDTEAVTIMDRTMLPLRVISEELGKYVYWNDKGIIIISDDYKAYTDTEAESRINMIK